jgi:indolepyruvate ferredoxin oxidoreductase, beta subunit
MNNFNIVISGTGGQGLITLLQILAEAALLEGHDVKTSELHGLSQRGGSVEAYVRFGKKVFSPLIAVADANLILGLELLEGLRMIRYANAKTIFLVNKYVFPFSGGLPEEEILSKIDLIKNEKHIIPASKICQEELGAEVVSGTYLLGYAISKNLIPLKRESVLEAISKVVPEKHFELNKKAFELAGKYGN